MTNRRTKPRQTSGRINQIALAVCIIGTVYYACTLIRQVLFAYSLDLSQYSASDVFTTIDLLMSLAGLMLLAWLASRKRYWFLSIAAILLFGSLLLVALDLWTALEPRAIVEILISLFRTAACFIASVGLLRTEKLSDVI